MRLVILHAATGIALSIGATAPKADIVLGFANPLSGPYLETGTRNFLAVMTAVEHINADGGVLGERLQVVTADDRCGVHEAVQAAEQLATAGVAMVVGHLCSHSSLVAAAVYDLTNLVMISPGSTHPRLTEEGRPNVFRVIGRDDQQGEAAADLIALRFPDARVAVAHDGSIYGRNLALQTHRDLEERRVAVTPPIQYEPNQPDYQRLAARLGERNVDVLYVAGYGPDAGRIARDVRRADLDLQLIGGDGLAMDEFWTTSEAAGNGTLLTTYMIPEPEDFQGESAARHRTVLAQFGASGLGAYAAVEVWAEAVERAGTTETKSVTYVLQRGHFDTVRGPITFDAKGDLAGAAWSWVVWRDGKIVPLEVTDAVN